MPTPPTFRSIEDYGSHLDDVSFWSPYVHQILTRHELLVDGRELQAGFVGTYPTFIHGDVVVKLFGCFPSWHANHQTERAVQELVSEDPVIRAPALLRSGVLHDDSKYAPWPYLISRRVPGTAWRDARLSVEQQHGVVAELGRQVAHLHTMRPPAVLEAIDWPAQHRVTATQRHKAWGCLAPHLIDQIDDWLFRWGPAERTIVHADLTADHVFVSDGHLMGIIDWGDAMLTERHYELAALHLDLLGCDLALLRTFLQAADWPVDDDFAHRALSMALLHQFDVLEGVASAVHMDDMGTLDELATALFGV